MATVEHSGPEAELRRHGLVRADLITAAILLCLGLFVVVHAWQMPRLEERQINPLTVPGIVPGLLGLVLIAMAAVLMIRSVRAGGHRARHQGANRSRELPDDGGSWRRLTLTALLCLVYAGGMVGHVDFRIATALFVFAFVVVFEWEPDGDLRARLRKVGWAALQAALVALAVAVIFQELFLVRLP